MTDRSAQAPVRGTESLWQRILTDSFEEIYLFDADTLLFIQVSRGALDNLGYSMKEMRRLTAADIKPDLSRAEFEAMIAPLLRGEEDLLVFETRHRRKDGSLYPVEVRLQLAREASPPVFIAIILDRTERQRSEKILQSSERRFRALVDQSPFAIQVFSPDGRTLAVNPAWERLTGARFEDMKNYNVLEDRQLMEKGVMPHLRKAFAGEAVEIPPVSYDTTQTPEVDVPATRFCVRSFVYPIKDNDGQVQEVILMHEDVSEKEQALRDLRRSEASLSEAQRIAHLGSWRLDLRSQELEWSDETFRIFEIDPKRFAASYEAFLDAIHPDDRERVHATYQAALEEKRSYEVEHRLLMADGRIKYVQERCETHFDEDGEPVLSVGTVQDISERKLAEIAAWESEQRFHILSKISPVGIFRTDAEGLCVYVNERWREIAGMDLSQALGEGWVAAIHPEDRQWVFDEWRRSARAQSPFRVECRFKHADGADGSRGRITWVLSQTSAERDDEGNITGYVGTITDITQQKRIEAALAELAAAGSGEAFFQRLVQGLATLFDAQKAFACRFLPEAGDEAENLAITASDGTSGRTRCRLQNSPCGKAIESGEILLANGQIGRRFDTAQCVQGAMTDAESFIGTPLLNSKGEAIGILGIVDNKRLEDCEAFRPILEMFAARATAELERQAAEQAIRNQRDQLEREVWERTAALRASNQELESFAYSVSHDLRAPLRAIDGFSRALLEDYGDCLDETAGGYLQRVRNGTQRMGRLIDDMLQLSRVTRSDFEREDVDLSALADGIIQQLQESSPRPEMEVLVDSGMVVSGDRRLLGVLLDNLLGNAWKYTATRERPRIEFGSMAQDGERIFFVRDNGVGFDMKYVGQIFVAFQRLHSSNEFEGSGVGLATVQRIVNRHGGRVWAEADVGNGAIFYFSLG